MPPLGEASIPQPERGGFDLPPEFGEEPHSGQTAMLTKTRSVLAVHSLEASVPFYRDVLGMNVDFEVPGWCLLSRDSFAVMLGECPDSVAARELGDHAYFAYVTVSDAAGLFQEFSARAAEFIKPLTNEPWGMREFGVRTVDGHRIMFGQEVAADDDSA